ncbi:Serine/Threonine kinase domain protein (macronuclear) [Tetrahymena thermophila SB210]|uniref:Serine/Threonine kinase domain protein n=1 Tax=Tetrahymena thermophila (strain SB210) TaxID=312017 RepID=I7MHW3_TETTS|nr:Serine/Threonine kinase domain protein [Tetrahymena thermophila SB210]EAR89941.1 Serine/Threonine kinase domain protein [Tetrahymena thermophila SB210]|eukprot:XP_001010186.1 Serine/Threonine kinase domain protein [Tetrahymena thermophila SB210]
MIKDPDQFNQNTETDEEAPYFIENFDIQKELDKYKYVKQSRNLAYQYLSENKLIIDQRYDLKKQTNDYNASYKCKAYDNKSHQDVFIYYYITFAQYDIYYLKQILKAIEIQKFLNHENIEKIYNFDIISYPEINKMYVVSDFMQTNLSFITQSQQQLTDEHIQFFMYQILRALHYIHSAKIVFGFLLPRFIQINSDCSIKISEFTSCVGNQNQKIRSYIHKNYYMSPEYIVEKIITEKSDIWSAGCIFAELINRVKLFSGHDDFTAITQILQFCGEQNEEDLKFYKQINREKLSTLMPKEEQISLQVRFPNANPLALDLLGKMLTFNLEKRFNALECLQHEYLADLYDPQSELICDQEFDWSFLDQQLTKEEIIMRLYKNQLFFQQN